MSRVPKPRAVLQHSNPRRGEKTHFRRELPGLFAATIKVLGEFAIEKHDGFADGHSIFRSSETEDIDAGLPSDFLGRNVERGDGIGKTRAIHMNAQIELACGFGQYLQLV